MNRPVWSLPVPIQAAAVPTAPQSEISAITVGFILQAPW